MTPTKGERYGTAHAWEVDVTVPTKWTDKQDGAYAHDVLGMGRKDQMIERICTRIADFHGVPSFAFAYMTQTTYVPGDGILDRLQLPVKLAILTHLFHQRSQDTDYLERFDFDLRRFSDVETISTPVLERYLLAPETVRLRELVDVHDAVLTATADLSESLACEHDDCPRYVSVDHMDPPLSRRRSS